MFRRRVVSFKVWFPFICLCGCFVTVGNASDEVVHGYPPKINPLILSAGTPQFAANLEKFDKAERKSSEMLFCMERGRLLQLTGDFPNSILQFNRAIELIDKADSASKVSPKKIWNKTKGVLWNDKARAYESLGFERILIHHYQALNYLSLGQYESARIEIRNANQQQEIELERHEKLLAEEEAKFNKKTAGQNHSDGGAETPREEVTPPPPAPVPEPEQSKKKNPFNKFVKDFKVAMKKSPPAQPSSAQPSAQPLDWVAVRKSFETDIDTTTQPLEKMLANTKNSFQNAYSFMLSGLLFEFQGLDDEAYIDYKKALEIMPENTFLAGEVLRLAGKLNNKSDLEFFQKKYKGNKPNKFQGTQMVVFFEDGLIPQKEELQLNTPLGKETLSLAIPVYRSGFQLNQNGLESFQPLHMASGAHKEKTVPLCGMQAMAARALKEQMTLIVLRMVTRLMVKVTATVIAQKQAGDLGTLLGGLYLLASEHADLRGWYSLPRNVQMSRFSIAEGNQEWTLSDSSGLRKSVTLNPKQNQLVILQVASFNNQMHVNVSYLDKEK